MSIEIGAVKIKDGFFIGDIYSARDLQFILLNKITRIINCCSTEIPNVFSGQGVLYIPFEWVQGRQSEYLDKEQIDQTCEFINNSVELGESVLIHSVRCRDRAVFMCACYLVKQFRWSANTAIRFIYSRREMPRMKPQLEALVAEYEKMEVRAEDVKYINWDDNIKNSILTPQELVLANTFLNTAVNNTEIKPQTKRNNIAKLQWNDRINSHRSSAGFKNRLCTSYVPAYEQLAFNKPILQDATFLKSCLKGSTVQNKIAVLKQNLIEPSHQHPLPRASSANFNRTQKLRQDSTKKLKQKLSTTDKQNTLQSQFYDLNSLNSLNLNSYAKRNTNTNTNTNTLELNTNKSLKLSSSASASNLHRSSSKKLEALMGKAKMTNFYTKFGVYCQQKRVYGSNGGGGGIYGSVGVSGNKMKKMASTKMIRPHSSNNVIGGITNNQVRSFMEGLIRGDDFPK